MVVIDQQRLLETASGLSVQDAYEAVDRAMGEAVSCLAELAGVATLLCGEELRPQACRAVLSVALGGAATLFGSAGVPCRPGGGAGALAAAVSAAIPEASGSAFLGVAALQAAERVVCVLSGPLQGAEQLALEASAHTLVALVGPQCRTFVGLSPSPLPAGSPPLCTARLLVTMPPAWRGAGAVAEEAAAEPTLEGGGVQRRREAISKLAAGTRAATRPASSDGGLNAWMGAWAQPSLQVAPAAPAAQAPAAPAAQAVSPFRYATGEPVQREAQQQAPGDTWDGGLDYDVLFGADDEDQEEERLSGWFGQRNPRNDITVRRARCMFCGG